MKRGKTRESSATAAKKKPKRTIENPGKISLKSKFVYGNFHYFAM